MVAKKRVLDYNFRVLFRFKYSPVPPAGGSAVK